jgi:hypothetical protein
MGSNWNDLVTSLTLYTNEVQVVQIFGNKDLRLDQGAGTFPPGKYTADQINTKGIGSGGEDETASSFIVPTGMQITLYASDNFLDDSLVLEPGEYKNLDSYSWDNKMKSLKVVRTIEYIETLVGKWQLIVFGNGIIKTTEEAGFVTTESTSNTET